MLAIHRHSYLRILIVYWSFLGYRKFTKIYELHVLNIQIFNRRGRFIDRNTNSEKKPLYSEFKRQIEQPIQQTNICQINCLGASIFSRAHTHTHIAIAYSTTSSTTFRRHFIKDLLRITSACVHKLVIFPSARGLQSSFAFHAFCHIDLESVTENSVTATSSRIHTTW